jgi:hypothetical protein
VEGAGFSRLQSSGSQPEHHTMKKNIAIVVGAMLLSNFPAQAEPSAADKKWLEVVEKVIAKGETSIATTSEQRMTMLKDWAAKKGYAVLVGKNEVGYHVELFPKIASR